MQIPRIDGESCISCGICSMVCPVHAIEVHSVAKVIRPEDCIEGCNECEWNCPTMAIEIVKQ